MKCSYCENNFSTKTSLNNHQKTAKYCLKLQNKDIQYKYKCESCNMCFHKIFNLDRHISICKSSDKMYKYIEKIKQQEEKIKEDGINIKHQTDTIIKYENTIKDLQDKLENIAIKSVSRATTTNKTQINNYIQQLQPVTDDHFNDSAQYLTIEHILKGAEGYANFALQNSLQDRMLCVDYSRRKVKFKDKDGHIIVDPEMTELATKLFKSIKEKNNELILECIERLKDNFGEEVDTIVKICDYRIAVDKGSEGEKT